MSATGNTIYTGDGSNLYAIDESGTLSWSKSISNLGLATNAVVRGGSLYLYGGSGVYSVSASDGTINWNKSFNNGHPPSVTADSVIVNDNNDIVSLNKDDGTEIWRYSTSFSDDSAVEMNNAPHLGPNNIYVGFEDSSEDGEVHAIDYDGNLQWKFTEPKSAVNSSPTVSNGNVFFVSGSPFDDDSDNSIYSLNADDGTKKWEYSLGAPSSRSPLVVNGLLYVGARDDKMYAVDADTGNLQWTFSANDNVSSATYSNGVIFFISWDENVYAVNTDGSKKWSTTLNETPYLLPTVYNGSVYCGTQVAPDSDLLFYSLDEETGNINWEYTLSNNNNSTSPTVVSDPSNGDSICSRVQQGVINNLSGNTTITPIIGEVGSDAPIWRSEIVFGDGKKEVLLENTNYSG
jgi:outer membrane protein assembly factor BamB